jgi:DNA-binding MarR family transcriptional regulator
MLRIHFTMEDLARVRVAPSADPLWETLLSLHLLGKSDGAVVFGDWKRRTGPRAADHVLRILFELAPPWGYSADFLTPTAGSPDIAAGIDTILCTARTRLRNDVGYLASARRLSAPTRALAAGERDALDRLGRALRSYFDLGLRPYWDVIQVHVDTDRSLRARTLTQGGVELLLSSLHPTIRWASPELAVSYPIDRDIYLQGRGLVLIPSFFCWLSPVTLQDSGLPPVLVYPIDHALGWSRPATGESSSRPLATLLGKTRAAVVETLAGMPGCTTTELAGRLRLPLSTASRQAAVLREAGLVTRHQEGRSVLHTLTPLGVAVHQGGNRTTERFQLEGGHAHRPER